MRLITIFVLPFLLAGQGIIQCVLTKCCYVTYTLTAAALALNIAVGGSAGNISLNDFVTVQDSDLTSQVWYTDYSSVSC